MYIIRRMTEYSSVSAKQLAEELNVSSRAIEKNIKKLKESGKIERIGPAKGGIWRINN